MKKSLSLQAYLNEVFLECYQEAREDTLQKYELPQEMFPQVPAFTVEDILNFEYLPSKN